MLSFREFLREDEDHYVREFHRRIAKHYPDGLVLYHESPGHVADSFRKKGIEGTYGIYATVGEPSNFVTSKEKTIVTFKLPAHHNSPIHIGPDMGYDPENPHADLLRQHPKIKGADVYINAENIPPHHIINVEEK